MISITSIAHNKSTLKYHRNKSHDTRHCKYQTKYNTIFQIARHHTALLCAGENARGATKIAIADNNTSDSAALGWAGEGGGGPLENIHKGGLQGTRFNRSSYFPVVCYIKNYILGDETNVKERQQLAPLGWDLELTGERGVRNRLWRLEKTLQWFSGVLL